jgi:uncharacterized protein YukE
MIARRFVLAWAIAILSLPAAVAAQGLGDTAARERVRRESESQDKKADTRPVYTNNDLKVYRPAGGEDDENEEGEGDEVDTAAEREARDEERRSRSRVRGRTDPNRAQRDEAGRAQSEVDQIEARIRRLNGKLNPMSRDYIYGQARSVDAANEEIQVRQELSELEERLRDARQDLANASDELSNADRGAYNPEEEE